MVDWRTLFFKYRSFTPIPVIVAALIGAETTPVSYISGLFLLFSGEALRIWSVRYAGSATRTTGQVGADELVTNGPFGHVRNPLYIGNFLLSLGILIAAWPWMPWFGLGFVLLYALQYGSIVSLEEQFLREKFTGIYRAYRAGVPRWIPRWRSWGRGDRSPTSLASALRTEKNTLQSEVAVVLLLTLRWLLS